MLLFAYYLLLSYLLQAVPAQNEKTDIAIPVLMGLFFIPLILIAYFQNRRTQKNNEDSYTPGFFY